MPHSPADGTYQATARTTASRARHRVSYDRALVHRILDEGFVCHLGFVREGAPVVLPTLYARDGERLYLHGSTGSAAMRAAADGGLPVCVTVTHVDGLVLAKAAFHHSVNYRSVVAHGVARRLTGEAETRRALDLLVDHVLPGRAADCRPASPRERAATAVLVLDLAEVSAKVREGGPNDEPGDAGLPHWAGVVPARLAFGTPVPAGTGDSGAALPDYLVSPQRPGTAGRNAA
ncbi:pyridoxamine 5'-phosphate oxidase family protein [Streptomyces sp. 7-21]|uniref:pyridoxamine 5'-phosphate oxidase family protein n=1 Tax=Streptomyces sp. 7-21 TaxID=2802283 RepID=UPI00191F66DA|nr:pyridoxamine 5'-phosphate oxidase family protein [Streptomyces sp. 7-21]MBL1067193.1 pyridoxamine 5'-phosphate oxidase family protein [Streptomyces sp. 7-21]